MRHPFLAVLLAVFLTAGCITTPRGQAGPVWQELRYVQTTENLHRTLVVREGMVFVDGPPATRSIGFLAGIYPLVAEDADYWFFSAPEPLEFRVFQDGRFGDPSHRPGGLMIAKRPHPVPAAAYTDGTGSTKLAVWQLGQEFLQLEGTQWRKNF